VIIRTWLIRVADVAKQVISLAILQSIDVLAQLLVHLLGVGDLPLNLRGLGLHECQKLLLRLCLAVLVRVDAYNLILKKESRACACACACACT
jgi:hypothetical protein